nr:Retrovirus-related Pol polyprotein from transposon TNT 1-94 [Cajanus cajan]KYP59401.1 Retrovirus-related Pol polyprotein from transposon TNT 1-94 [Cajanus cajan]
MGNQGVSKVVGIGEIWLKTNIGCKLHLKNVRHIPDMRLNLISIQELDEDGYHNSFGNGKWKCTKWTLVITKGEKQNTLYWISAKLSTP